MKIEDLILDALPLVFIIAISYNVLKLLLMFKDKGAGGMMGMFKSNHKQFTME